jgi:hypothetical protein
VEICPVTVGTFFADLNGGLHIVENHQARRGKNVGFTLFCKGADQSLELSRSAQERIGQTKRFQTEFAQRPQRIGIAVPGISDKPFHAVLQLIRKRQFDDGRFDEHLPGGHIQGLEEIQQISIDVRLAEDNDHVLSVIRRHPQPCGIKGIASVASRPCRTPLGVVCAAG